MHSCFGHSLHAILLCLYVSHALCSDTHNGWFKCELHAKTVHETYRALTGALPRDSLVKSHMDVKLVSITFPLIHQPPCFREGSSTTLKTATNTNCSVFTQTSHQESIQRAVLISKWETGRQTSQVGIFLAHLTSALFVVCPLASCTFRLPTPLLVPSACIHSTLQLVSGARWLVQSPRGSSVKVTSIT